MSNQSFDGFLMSNAVNYPICDQIKEMKKTEIKYDIDKKRICKGLENEIKTLKQFSKLTPEAIHKLLERPIMASNPYLIMFLTKFYNYDINIKNKDGNSSLHFAAMKKSFGKLFYKLISLY